MYVPPLYISLTSQIRESGTYIYKEGKKLVASLIALRQPKHVIVVTNQESKFKTIIMKMGSLTGEISFIRHPLDLNIIESFNPSIIIIDNINFYETHELPSFDQFKDILIIGLPEKEPNRMSLIYKRLPLRIIEDVELDAQTSHFATHR